MWQLHVADGMSDILGCSMHLLLRCLVVTVYVQLSPGQILTQMQ